MTRHFLLFLFFLTSFLPQTLLSQRSVVDNQQLVNAAGNSYSPSGNVMRTYDNRFKGIEGSPYLMNDWMDAMVVSESGSIFQDLRIRYNIETDDVVLASNDGSNIMLPREEIAEFTMENRYDSFRFVAMEDPDDQDGRKMFCQILEEGPVQVLVRRRKYFVPGSNTLAFGHQDHGQYKFHQDRFYVRNREIGETIKVGRINRPIYRFLGNHTDELKEVARVREWYVSNPEALIGLIRYYNMLER